VDGTTQQNGTGAPAVRMAISACTKRLGKKKKALDKLQESSIHPRFVASTGLGNRDN